MTWQNEPYEPLPPAPEVGGKPWLELPPAPSLLISFSVPAGSAVHAVTPVLLLQVPAAPTEEAVLSGPGRGWDRPHRGDAVGCSSRAAGCEQGQDARGQAPLSQGPGVTRTVGTSRL